MKSKQWLLSDAYLANPSLQTAMPDAVGHIGQMAIDWVELPATARNSDASRVMVQFETLDHTLR